MNQNLSSRRGIPSGWLMALVVLMSGALTGCNYLLFAGYLIGGPPSIAGVFETETGQSMTDKDVVVAVVCFVPKEVKWDFANIDYDLAKYVSNRMFCKKIKVINPDRIRDWLDKHPDWDSPDEIGAAFGATYVVHIEVNEFSLYEKNSSDLFRGRSDVLISVWEMEGETGEQIFTKDLESVYPRAVPRSTYDTKYTTFKREYYEVLSEDIGQLFYSHYTADDIFNVN